jgi:hypothetical protein
MMFLQHSSAVMTTTSTAVVAAAAPLHRQAQSQRILLQQSRPLITITERTVLRRFLQENEENNDAAAAAAAVDDYVETAAYPYDLSTFSIRFDKCQNVRYYSDDLAADEDATSPLAIKPLVAFRLCPSTECQTCGSSSSSSNYGKYVVDLESYLAYTVENQRQSFEEMCNNCAELCNDAGEYCNGCGKLCYQYANVQAAGLVDASDYMECQELEMPDENENNARRRMRKRRLRRTRNRRRKLESEDGEEGEENPDEDENADEDQQDDADEDEPEEDEDEEEEEESVDEEEEPIYFIGPKCSSSGQKIEIGLFYDEYCTQAVPQTDESSSTMNLTTILGGTLSYHLMSHSFTDDGSICLSCQEPADENEQHSNDQADADDVNEMCEELYNAAAKCETPTGITAGFIQTNRDDGEYENQVETEFIACTFIDSIYWNSYTAAGDIEYRKPLDVYERYVTKRQAIVLASLGVFIACCFLAAYWLERRIKQVTEQNKLVAGSSGKTIGSSKSLGVMS